MFFLKPKPKFNEVLPPPPPEAEFEEQSKEEPNFFEETIKPEEETETLPEEKEFDDLTKDLDIELEPQKEVSKKEKTVQKAKVTKKQKIPKKIDSKKPTLLKTTKEKSLPLKKTISVKQIKKEKISLKKPLTLKKQEITIKPKKSLQPKLKKEKLEDIDFILPKELKETSEKEVELPHELEKPEEIKLPETLEDLDMGDFGKDLGVEKSINKGHEIKEKSTEILEAEEEIKSAIDNIKKQEKTSFFKRLFSRKEKVQEKPIEEHLMPELPEVNQISIIQNSINKAKDALIKFDLETAKKNYIEVMKIYNTIKPEEQSKVYHDIKELYFERKSAEGLKA